MVVHAERFLIVQVDFLGARPPEAVTASVLLGAIRDSIRETFGDFGRGSWPASHRTLNGSPARSELEEQPRAGKACARPARE